MRSRRCAGFTLIEMLIVLAIIAGLFTLVPAVMAGIPGFRLRAATASVADTLRQLQDRALRTGVPTVFRLDAGGRQFSTDTSASPVYRPLPAVIDAAALSTVSPVQSEARTVLRFFPDGSATGATLRLRHGTRSETVAVDWLTGRVSTDE